MASSRFAAAAPRLRRSGLDVDRVTLDGDRIDLLGNHAGRIHHFAGLDVEPAVVEIALDHLALDVAFRERARPVRAQVVQHIEGAVEIEDGEHEAVRLDLLPRAFIDFGSLAQFDRRHGLLVDVPGPALYENSRYAERCSAYRNRISFASLVRGVEALAVEAEVANLKITFAQDLKVAEALLTS